MADVGWRENQEKAGELLAKIKGRLPELKGLLEAFFHTKYFLEMAARYGEELEAAPESDIPSGWAALLCLYELR